MEPFWIVVASFAAGCVIGVFVAVVTRRDKGAKALEQELLELRQEYDNYRIEVGNHFVETSNLVNQMTQSYRDVHQHLSKGAQNLCDADLAKQLREETAPLIEHVVESSSKPAAADVAETSGAEPAGADDSELEASYDAGREVTQVDEAGESEQVEAVGSESENADPAAEAASAVPEASEEEPRASEAESSAESPAREKQGA